MPPTPSQSTLAGVPRRAAARSQGAGQRRTPADAMRDLSDDLDQLQRLEARECRSAAEHDRKVALVEKIAAAACKLKQHYRGPSEAPCHPPIYRSPCGQVMGW